MVKFRVLTDQREYSAGQIVDVKPRNVPIWRKRKWAELVKDEPAPETATLAAPEKAVRKTGKRRKLKHARKKAADA